MLLPEDFKLNKDWAVKLVTDFNSVTVNDISNDTPGSKTTSSAIDDNSDKPEEQKVLLKFNSMSE